jgi:2-dehydro-3-deoxyphosphogluconate aldolase/(4S)-4-hydroxy-2-oxoglutarate aldolase
MSIKHILKQAPVIPVMVIHELEHALPLARALVDGGLPVLEITLRTEQALEAIRVIAAEVPDAIVGVGTLTHPSQFEQSLHARARFAVSPGLTPNLIDAAKDSDLPLLPGVFTPGEAMLASDHGFDTLKLFPAAQAGGVGMLKALSGPLADLSFCPTGGIGRNDFLDYLKLPNVLCVGGSWVAPASAMNQGDWNQITELARDAVSASQSL